MPRPSVVDDALDFGNVSVAVCDFFQGKCNQPATDFLSFDVDDSSKMVEGYIVFLVGGLQSVFAVSLVTDVTVSDDLSVLVYRHDAEIILLPPREVDFDVLSVLKRTFPKQRVFHRKQLSFEWNVFLGFRIKCPIPGFVLCI